MKLFEGLEMFSSSSTFWFGFAGRLVVWLQNLMAPERDLPHDETNK